MAKEWVVSEEDLGCDGAYLSCSEVVRCKDCKHNSLKRMSGNTYCDLGIGLFQLYDFCSLGERRTDAN